MSPSNTTTGDSTTGDSTTGAARPAEPVHDNEGQTPAAWTACGGIIAASLVAAAAVILGSIPLTVLAVVVALAGLAAGALLERTRRARDEPSRGGRSDDQAAEPTAAGRRDVGPGARGRSGDATPYDRESDNG